MNKRDDLDAPSTVLVTGAAGGLGVHLVCLLAEAGWQVHAFDQHSPDDVGRGPLVDHGDNISWHIGPGMDSEFRHLLKKCDVVVHAAGITSLSAPEAELVAANHNLALRLFRLATEAGNVEHFVYLSCASVYQTDIRVRTEASPTEAKNAFEKSKLTAEEALHSQAEIADGAPDLTILRLGLLYGPGCTTMGAGLIPLPAILRDVSRYLPGLAGGPRTNWCHVRDAAAAVDLVLRHRDGRGRVFNVVDETALSFGEIVTSIIEAYDIDLGPSVRIPGFVLWPLLGPLLDNDAAFERMRAFLQFLWRRVQRSHGIESPLTPRLNRDALFYARDDSIVVADALRDLGWRPRWADFRQGIAETVRWYQDHGWAPRFDRDSLVERRDASPRSRLHYNQTLAGELADGDARPLQLTLEVSWPSVPWPPTGGEGRLHGTLRVPGLAEGSPIRGTLQMKWLPRPRIIYEFGFRDLNDQACRFRGIRRLDTQTPLATLRRVDATLIDRFGETIGSCVLHNTEGPWAFGAQTEQDDTAR